MEKLSKITGLLLMLIFYRLTASGQVLSSFFSQQAEKKKLMEAQLAGYQAYLLAIKRCYRITRQGLSGLYALKQSTADQHAAYFHELSRVNAAIREGPAYQTIIAISRKIGESLKIEMIWQQTQDQLTPQERSDVLNFFAAIGGKCTADLTKAEQLVTENGLQLSDKQRLDALQNLCINIADRWRLVSGFVQKCHQLVFSRLGLRHEAAAVRQLYSVQ